MSSNQITEHFASALESEFYNQDYNDKQCMWEWFTTFGEVDAPKEWESKVSEWGFIPVKDDIESEFGSWLSGHWEIDEHNSLHDPILGSIEWDDIKEQLMEYFEEWAEKFPEKEESVGEGEGEGEESDGKGCGCSQDGDGEED
jgi:hypothetical protein